MYINISYKFHRIPDTQSHFITKVQDLLGQPSYISNKAKHKNMCFIIHEILKYEKNNILMEKMGKQYNQTPLISPTMFRKYCVWVGEEGDLSLLW